MKCNICGGLQEKFDRKVILGKYEAEYFHCSNCGFICIADPTWLNEAYSNAIAITDTGLVSRNLDISEALAVLLPSLDGRLVPILDLGGGTGLLVRLMRDRGFNFFWSDKFAKNEFSRGFEAEKPFSDFPIKTAFEVLEHLEKPADFVEEACVGSEFFIFTTELYEGFLPDTDWWYFAPETGQHICFFNLQTLQALAQRLGMQLFTNGSFHLFARPGKMNHHEFAWRTSRAGKWLARLLRTRSGSLTLSDHASLVSLLRQNQDVRSKSRNHPVARE